MSIVHLVRVRVRATATARARVRVRLGLGLGLLRVSERARDRVGFHPPRAQEEDKVQGDPGRAELVLVGGEAHLGLGLGLGLGCT